MLSERKMKILSAIVRGYVQTAEPVGSRTIEKKHNIGISSATIRNEMSDLEEMGLIIKPHTSAGSIPSERGYRIFVDEIVKSNGVSNNELEVFTQIINKNIEHIDYLMRETAKMISDVTKTITVVSEPKTEQLRIKNISFVPLDERSCVIVIVTEDKQVASKTVEFESDMDFTPDELFNFGLEFTEALYGLTINDITNTHFINLRDKLVLDEIVIARVMKVIIEVLNERNSYKVHTYGREKLFSLPDFSEAANAVELFKSLEQNQILVSILGETNENVQVLIGSENEIEQMKNCSIIRRGYSLGNTTGCIGVIGPTRMEYEKTINTINYVVDHLKNIDINNEF